MVIYKLRAHPLAKEDKIELRDGVLHVYTREKAEKNKANLAVLKLLAKYFNKPAKEIKLKGLTSRNKFAEVA
mgnify:CR=1 FL=1